MKEAVEEGRRWNKEGGGRKEGKEGIRGGIILDFGGAKTVEKKFF